jgi:hypothetical protein
VEAKSKREAKEIAIEMFNSDYDQNYEDWTQVFANVKEVSG